MDKYTSKSVKKMNFIKLHFQQTPSVVTLLCNRLLRIHCLGSSLSSQHLVSHSMLFSIIIITFSNQQQWMFIFVNSILSSFNLFVQWKCQVVQEQHSCWLLFSFLCDQTWSLHNLWFHSVMLVVQLSRRFFFCIRVCIIQYQCRVLPQWIQITALSILCPVFIFCFPAVEKTS